MSEFIAYRADPDFTFMVDKIAARIQHEIDQAALDKAAHTLEQFGYVKVVRCRDCIYADNDWCEKHGHFGWSVNGFCAWGERKEGDE